jgi:predicted metal-dependent hydrolase
MRLAVRRDGSVTLTLPTRVPLGAGEAFVQRLASWALSRIAILERTPVHPVSLYGRAEYLEHREHARLLIASRLAVFAPVLGVSYGRVSIRAERTCWGSCSRSGNLNFNYKILFLPAHLQDYVIVHELAHLRELSHSARFWAVVGSVLPSFCLLRRELRGMGML